MPLQPKFLGPMEPVYACREMPTRHCPAAYDSVCGDRPCARYESEDPRPWIPELGELTWCPTCGPTGASAAG
jgi:hypothetical protein